MRLLKLIGINILLLGIVSFLTDVSSEMIMPILPMFISSLGGAGIAIGLVGGLGDSIAGILKVISGYLSDKIGKRKIFVALGYFSSALSKLLFPFSTSWHHILILRPIERIGKGLRTAPRDAIIADSAPEEVRGRAFGLHRTLDTSGAILGSFLAFIFIWVLGAELRTVLWIAAAIAFTALIPLFFVKEKKREPQKITFKIGFKGLSKKFKIFTLIATVFALGNFTYMFFIMRASEFFPKELNTTIPIFLYIVFNFVYASLSIPAGNLSDKIGRKKVLAIGYFLFSFTCLTAIFSNSFPLLLLVFILYGISNAFVNANQRAFASDLSKEELRGTALGTFHTSISLASLPAGMIAGVLWQIISPQVTFIYGALLSSLSAILFFILL